VTFAATAGMPMNQAGLASGLINTTRQVGGSIGLAVLATVSVETTAAALAGPGALSLPAALTAGYSRAFDVSVWLFLGAAFAALIVPSVTRRAAPVVVGAEAAEAATAAEAT
jgi:hypothetical protein